MTVNERIQRSIEALHLQYGDQKAILGDDQPPVSKIPTGSLELDYATGGGIPVGRWTRMYGGPSSGKSTKCWNIISNAQKLGYTCAYYNAEKQYTAEFAEKQGVDVSNLLVVETSVIEDIGEIMEGLLDDIDIHIIDSCSSTISRTEMADGLNEREYIGIRPKRWATQFSFVNERFDTKRNCIILVDQVRIKGIGTGFTSEGPPGGKYMEHVSSMTIEFRRGGYLWYDKDNILTDTRNTKQKTLSGSAEPDGVEIKAKVVKSRVCRPFRTANMKFDLNLLEFDSIDELIRSAKFFGTIEASGGWMKLPGEEKSIRPREFRTRLEEDESLRQEIVAKALEERL